jgi:hypothetical protein
MDQSQSVRAASIRLSTVATTTRQTPKTDFGTVMRDGLMRAGNVAVEGLRVAAPFVPGGAIVSAALAGANAASGMIGPSFSGGGGEQGAYSSAGGSRGAVYGSSASGLSGGQGPMGGGTVNGALGGGNTLGLPGRRPGLSTQVGGAGGVGGAANVGGGVANGNGAAGSDAFNSMMNATRQMAEFQASFNLQYLQLQEKIQIDTRQFNLISNVMKTKHDAAKNALNNVR